MHDYRPPPHPAWLDDLLAHVGRAFERTGAGTPGWPDPHPDRSPREEEYSRCLDPDKYQILRTRIDAWVEVLESRGIVIADSVEPSPRTGAVRGPEHVRRVRRLAPTREGGLGVHLGETIVDGDPFGIDLGVSTAGGESSVVLLDTVPDCGCDACDSGSEDLLAVLDGWILSVARGGVVHARSATASVSRTIDGWAGSGAGAEPDLWLDESLPAPPGVERWVGEPWVYVGALSSV